MRGIEILASIGVLFILIMVICVGNEVALKLKDRFRFRCPKCGKVYKIEDRYCRACGYKLNGIKGWLKRREEKENE